MVVNLLYLSCFTVNEYWTLYHIALIPRWFQMPSLTCRYSDFDSSINTLCILYNIVLQQLDDNLAELTAKFEEATAAKVKCQKEAEATGQTISLANRLVGGLASEKASFFAAVNTISSCHMHYLLRERWKGACGELTRQLYLG